MSWPWNFDTELPPLAEQTQKLIDEVARDRQELGRWRLVARFIGEDRGLDLSTPEKLLAALHANQIPT
jgi:hypothetical protein